MGGVMKKPSHHMREYQRLQKRKIKAQRKAERQRESKAKETKQP
jgi:hypothetical protein